MPSLLYGYVHRPKTMSLILKESFRLQVVRTGAVVESPATQIVGIADTAELVTEGHSGFLG